MKIEKKHWIYSTQKERDIKKISEELEITYTTAKVLLNRGINDIEEASNFLNPSLDKLHDPFLLKDMGKAVSRIKEALKNKESIWIYGDYDVDGIASISILVKYFKSIGHRVDFYIPDRIKEGYGVNKNAIDTMSKKGADLIITVDCGISSVKEVDYAKELGIDLIITDHHQCQDTLPEAYAIINPKQDDCKYPCNVLCGCGIAFKLIQALIPREDFLQEVYGYLDIVAIATVADVVPLIDENRIIVFNALKHMNKTKNLGLKSLLDITKLKDRKISTGHIGFVIAPRINAVGRIGSADIGVRLLTTTDSGEARELAEFLEEENQKRQEIESEIYKEALEIIEENPQYKQEKILVLDGENWHHGVIGIVASRIVELYNKPVIILARQDNILKGSARSIPSFDLFESLKLCQELFINFGGHKQAAGLSLEIDNIEIFRERINNIADEILTDDDLIPKIHSDGYLALEGIEDKLLDEIESLEPFGLGNPTPRFINLNLKTKDIKAVGRDKKHLKMCLENKVKSFDSIGFNMGRYSNTMDKSSQVAALFTPEYNEFNGHTKIQLNIQDLKVMKSNEMMDKTLEENYFNSIGFTQRIIDKEKINTINDTYYPICFTNDKGQSFLEHMESQNYKKSLVMINTLQGLENLMRTLEIRNGAMDLDFDIHYNYIKNNSKANTHIVVNPNIDKIQYKLYNSIIIYDMLFSKEEYFLLLKKTENLYKKFFYTDDDEKDNLDILKRIIPSRKILVKVYKYFKKHNILLDRSMDEILQDMRKDNLNMNSKLLEHAITIFDQGDLIDFSIKDNLYTIKTLEIKEKINIEQLSTFKYYDNLSKEFINFKNTLLDNRGGGK